MQRATVQLQTSHGDEIRIRQGEKRACVRFACAARRPLFLRHVFSECRRGRFATCLQNIWSMESSRATRCLFSKHPVFSTCPVNNRSNTNQRLGWGRRRKMFEVVEKKYKQRLKLRRLESRRCLPLDFF